VAKRVVSAIIALPILTAVVWAGGLWYTLIIFAACVLGALEYHKISPAARSVPVGMLSIAGTILFLLNAQLEGKYTDIIVTAVIIISLGALIFIRGQIERYLWSLWMLGGILYLGWMGSHFLLLRDLEMGREWTVLTMYSTFATDTAALMVGTWLGRHHMSPDISPGKTWEGAAGGLVGGTVAAPVLALLLGLSLELLYLLAIGTLIALSAQVGDLVESIMKRSAGVKESGVLVPGHGGILDRLDSLIFVTPVIYYYVKWLATP